MAHFNGGAVPMHRQLKGLLLPGLPRGRILAKAARAHRFPLPPLPSSSSRAARRTEERSHAVRFSPACSAARSIMSS